MSTRHSRATRCCTEAFIPRGLRSGDSRARRGCGLGWEGGQRGLRSGVSQGHGGATGTSDVVALAVTVAAAVTAWPMRSKRPLSVSGLHDNRRCVWPSPRIPLPLPVYGEARFSRKSCGSMLARHWLSLLSKCPVILCPRAVALFDRFCVVARTLSRECHSKLLLGGPIRVSREVSILIRIMGRGG